MNPDIRNEWAGATIVMLVTAWLISHAHPELWITPTWSTGGDVASQVFYAAIFADEWFFNGKISGWMPESFAGFPAFTFYFPLPFSLIALLSPIVGTPIAFKLVSMSPAFLLPAATYAMLGLWRWPVALRLAGLAGAAGFILTEETSIWGGNILAQLAGEFAYSWGLLWAVLFWGMVVFSWRRGKGWWIIAALLEAAVAMSHGYALLMAGFGAFALLFFSRQPWRDLRLLLATHALAFLLIGFWLMPLVENLPWTIPNDTSTHVERLGILWPRSLWPLALGLPLIFVILRYDPPLRAGFKGLSVIALLGMLGFFAGHMISLAELRFFPYAQWATAVACAVALGWLLTRTPLAGVPLVGAMIVALMVWWEPHIKNPEDWSKWNLAGYQSKPMWPVFRDIAQINGGPLFGPRVIFEHDPDNNDIGSTRALEALPLFGSRPALEGLYMESSITSPFIYQLQEQISKRPSAPLSRYPTTPRSLDHAVRYLNEMYTNRVILRSEHMKARYADDPRFNVVADVGPFRVLELTAFNTHLVDLVDSRLIPRDRTKWMDDAYRRFSVSGNYDERHVFLGKKQTWPGELGHDSASQSTPRIVEFERERFVFETDAVGQPHLIRMTFHPRWRSTGGEEIYLVEPSFMLIIPQQNRVELRYAWSWGDYVGAAFSIAAVTIIALMLATRWPLLWPPFVAPVPIGTTRRAPMWVFITLVGTACAIMAYTWWTDPEHVYARGHRLFAENRWNEAAVLFERVTESRRVPAARAEALFWAARTHDLAGEIPAAETHYREVVEKHPENYWYPESLHRLILIAINRDERGAALTQFEQLKRDTPESRWTGDSRRALQEKGWLGDMELSAPGQ